MHDPRSPHRFGCLFLAVTIALAPALPAIAATPSAQRTAAAEVAEQLGGIFATMEASLALIPRAEYEPAALAATLGEDPEAHLAWVRDQTDWVPYPGALRGPRGVLADRVGNSVDRALLLAEMLESAGHTVRLQRAELGADVAASLGDRVRTARVRSVATVEVEVDESVNQLLAVAAEQGADVDALRARFEVNASAATAGDDELNARIDRQATFLQSLVNSHRTSGMDPQAARIESLRDHWWVQVRVGRAWVDLDPLLADSEPGDRITDRSRTVSFNQRNGEIQLPRGVAHEVEVRVIVEQSRNGRLREREALSHVLRPDTLHGRSVNLAIVAGHSGDGEPSDAPGIAEEIQARTARRGEWAFVLRDRNAVIQGRAMLADGSVATADLSPGGSRERLGGALDRLGALDRAVGGDSDRDDTFASAAWLEYEVRVPGRSPTIARRPIFDLFATTRHLGETAREITPQQRLEREAALLQSIDIVVLGALLHPDVIADRALRRALSLREPMLAVAAKPSPATVAQLREAIVEPSLPIELYALAAARLQPDTSEYLVSPTVIASKRGYRLGIDDDVRAHHAFDIVANHVDSLAPDTFAARLRQGVADTNLEALLLGSGGEVSGAANRLAQSSEPGDDWMLLTAPPADAAANDPDPAATRVLHALVTPALAAGNLVVVPRDPRGEPVWWRIDPATGTTLGLTAEGGQAGAERTTTDIVWRAVIKHGWLLPCVAPAAIGILSLTTACALLGFNTVYPSALGRLPLGRAALLIAIAFAGLELLLVHMDAWGLP